MIGMETKREEKQGGRECEKYVCKEENIQSERRLRKKEILKRRKIYKEKS